MPTYGAKKKYISGNFSKRRRARPTPPGRTLSVFAASYARQRPLRVARTPAPPPPPRVSPGQIPSRRSVGRSRFGHGAFRAIVVVVAAALVGRVSRSFLDLAKSAARTRERRPQTFSDTSEFPPKGFSVAGIRKWRRARAAVPRCSGGHLPRKARLASLIFQSSCGHYREFAFHLE